MRRKIMLAGSGVILCIMILLFVTNQIQPFDRELSTYVSHLITPDLTHFLHFITQFGDVYGLIPLIVIMLVFLYKKDKKNIPAFLFLMITSMIAAFALKNIFTRSRPDIIHLFTFNGYSFPSAHSLMNASFYGYAITTILKFFQGKAKYLVCIFLFLMILLIGFSRIYLGAHYVSDVITGYATGLLLLNITLIIEEKRKEKIV